MAMALGRADPLATGLRGGRPREKPETLSPAGGQPGLGGPALLSPAAGEMSAEQAAAQTASSSWAAAAASALQPRVQLQ